MRYAVSPLPQSGFKNSVLGADSKGLIETTDGVQMQQHLSPDLVVFFVKRGHEVDERLTITCLWLSDSHGCYENTAGGCFRVSLKRRLRRQKGVRSVEQSQYRAIQLVRDAAQKKSSDAWATLKAICDRSNRPYRLIEDVIKTIMNEGQIALHFHPDRVLASGQTIAASLALSGRYSNQFVTHKSNGMLAPYADSPRTR